MTIDKLKEQGHELLNEYIYLDKRHIVKRDTAYKLLSEKMHGRNPHFGQMKDKNNLMLAVGSLKKMIYKKKLELEQKNARNNYTT